MKIKKCFICLFVVLFSFITFPVYVNGENNSLYAIQEKLYNISHNNILETYDDERVKSLLNEVEEYALYLLKNKEIVSYELTSSSVVLNHCDGLTIVFSPIIKNTYSGETTVDTNTIDIYTIQSWYDDDSMIVCPALPIGIDNDAKLIPAVANNLASLSYCNYDESKSIKNIALPFVSTDTFSLDGFNKNQIIIWQGHGCWGGSDVHSVLWTKRAFDIDAYEEGGQYKTDCDLKRIVMVNGYDEAITSKYIDAYCHDMSNSLIYLGQCESGYDPVLAHAFLDKGASAVVANSKTIQATYGDIMQYTTLNLLSQTNPSTGKLYTLKQALEKAKQTYGEDDKAVNPYAYGAKPLIFGNENYSLSELTIPQNLYYDEIQTGDRIIASINEGFDFVLQGSDEPLQTNTPGTYNVEAKLNAGYIWPDGTFDNIPTTLTISKAYTKITDFVAPIEKDNLSYTGSNIELLTTGTPFGRIHYGIDNPDSDEDIIYDTLPVSTLYAGTYQVVWYADGKNENYLSYGSSENPITYFVDVDFGYRENINCLMDDFYLKDVIPNPSIDDQSIYLDEDAIITFYFNTQNKYTGATNWNDVDKDSLGLGTYYMYATIKDKHDVYRYYIYDTPIVEFNIIEKPLHKEYLIPNTGIN